MTGTESTVSTYTNVLGTAANAKYNSYTQTQPSPVTTKSAMSLLSSVAVAIGALAMLQWAMSPPHEDIKYAPENYKGLILNFKIILVFKSVSKLIDSVQIKFSFQFRTYVTKHFHI